MAHWHVTFHGNAVNLDYARQLFVRVGHDGLWRVVAEFLDSAETGQTSTFTLESGHATEADAERALRQILFGSGQAPAELRQSGNARAAVPSPVG